MGLEKVSFHSNPKECLNYCTIALISYTSKVMLKILQARLQQYMNCELPEFKLDLEKAQEPKIKLATSVGSSKRRESSREIYSALSTTPKPLTVGITTNCGKFWEMGIPDHLTCLLRNLYAGQEATVRTRHGTMDWFQIGKGIHPSCILLPAYFTSMQSKVKWSSSVVSDSLRPHGL